MSPQPLRSALLKAFHPTSFLHIIVFSYRLLHIPRELNVIGDVFEQIDPFEGLLAHDVFGRY